MRAVSTLREDRDALLQVLEAQLSSAEIDPSAQTLDLSGSVGLSERAITEAIRRFVAHHGTGRPPSRRQVARLKAALAEPGRSRTFDLPELRLVVEAGRLRVDRSHPESVATYSLPIGETVSAPSLGFSVEARVEDASASDQRFDDPHRVVFDLDALGADAVDGLLLRGARPGDRFRPFGLGGSVRLLRWLAGAGIPRSARAFVPVVECGGSIIWVVSHRRSDTAPVTETTRRLLVLTVTNE